MPSDKPDQNLNQNPELSQRPAAAASQSAADIDTAISGIDPAALWQAVCRVSADYIAVIDRTGTIRFCNRIDTGWALEEVTGRSILDFTMPESTEHLYQVIEQVFTTGEKQALETTVRAHHGGLDYFSVRVGPVLIDGHVAAILICCENILPLKTSEESLRHERGVLRRLLTIQERERQLVSYEIHDGLAQYIAGAMMHLEAFEHAAGDMVPGSELREGLRLLRAAGDEARRLISGLRPPALDELGIIDAVETLVSDARIEVPRVEFTHSLTARRLPPDVETTVFRIVQESLSNVRRHAHAQMVSVRLEQTAADGVRIVVEDDGSGFDVKAVPDDRFGLEGIRQRARLLGGETDITSSPSHGTTVCVTLPLNG